MFYLRVMFEGKGDNVSNISLGKSYRKITKEFKCGENWVSEGWKNNPNCDILIYPDVGDPIPLFSDNTYFIVTENGNTYERIKF